jgi:hypothetical protein
VLDDLTFNWPFWYTPPNEEHEVGGEVDISNPISKYQDWFGVLVDAMAQGGCYLGFKQQGVDADVSGDRRTYWASRDIVHFVCTGIRTRRGPVN